LESASLKYEVRLLLEANHSNKAELDVTEEGQKNCQCSNNVNFVVARIAKVGKQQTNRRN
jgi:hypothetical protein